MKARLGLIAVVIFLLALFAYQLKSQRELDFFKQFHLGQVIPAQALQKHFTFVSRNKYSSQSTLLKDVFEVYTSATSWSRLWSPEKSRVRAHSAAEGPDGSRCLKIESQSRHSWGMWSNTWIEVLPGDRFRIEGKIRRENVYAHMTVKLNGEDKKGALPFRGRAEAEERDGWQDVRFEFTIPEGARWMRLGLSGRGEGTAWFDDAALVCEKKV